MATHSPGAARGVRAFAAALISLAIGCLAAVLDAVSPLRPSVVATPVSDGAQRTVFELLKAEGV